MKTLFFCRHAKSDWSTSLPDHERPLNDRGHKSIPVMAKVWKDLGEVPTHWMSSSAERALRTAQLLSGQFEQAITLQVDHQLYHADVKDWMKIINDLPAEYSAISLFGHNPGITDVVNYLSNSAIDNIPTCGLAKVNFEIPEWRLVSNGIGTLEWFEYPKKHHQF